MLVRMRVGISGHRNGERWPAPPGTLDVPEAEAADLIRSELAEPADKAAEAVWERLREDIDGPRPGHPSKLDGRPASQVEGERLAAEAAAAEEARYAEAAQEAVRAEAVPDETEPPGEPLVAPDVAAEGAAGSQDTMTGSGTAEPPGIPEAPGPAAPKATWIAWAVYQGADEDKAAAMTKADLMSRYGGRL